MLLVVEQLQLKHSHNSDIRFFRISRSKSRPAKGGIALNLLSRLRLRTATGAAMSSEAASPLSDKDMEPCFTGSSLKAGQRHVT